MTDSGDGMMDDDDVSDEESLSDTSEDSLRSDDSSEFSGNAFSSDEFEGDMELEEKDENDLKLCSAAMEGDWESMKRILSEHSDLDLLHSRDTRGRTPLHNCNNVLCAQLLFKVAGSSAKGKLLFDLSSARETVLHTSVESGNAELVDYILNEAKPEVRKMIFGLDEHKSTALHYIRNKDSAKSLLKCIKDEDKINFIFASDEYGLTALHQASTRGLLDTIRYLLEQAGSQDQKLLLQADIYGRSPLSYAKDAATTKLLISSFNQSSKFAYIFQCDHEDKTAFRVTVDEGYRLGVVQCLLSQSEPEDQKLLQMLAKDGSTALHEVLDEETARVLIEAVQPSNMLDFLFKVNKKGRTALHTASESGTEDVIIYLVDQAGSEAIRLLMMGDNEGRNVLHLATDKHIARRLLKLFVTSLELSDESNGDLIDGCSYIKALDKHGNSSLSMAIVQYDCQYELFKYLLKYVDNRGTVADLKMLLETRNSSGRNIFHLACISSSIEKLFHVLKDHRDMVDVESVVLPDNYGNSPVSYIASRYYTRWFADILMKLPLVLRRQLCSNKNSKGVDVKQIVQRKKFDRQYYLDSILCEPYTLYINTNGAFTGSKSYYRQPFDKYVYRPSRRHDNSILKVLHFALNYYSILDPASVISLDLCMKALNESVTASPFRRGNIPELKGRIESAMAVGGEALWLFIQDKIEENTTSTTNLIQQSINSMDMQGYHGRPKVAVCQVKTDSDRPDDHQSFLKRINFISPGPDFIIISVLLKTVSTDKYSCEKRTSNSQQHLQHDIDSVLRKLASQTDVIGITVNSTLGRRYTLDLETPGIVNRLNTTPEITNRPDAAFDATSRLAKVPESRRTQQIVVDGSNKGMALIICITKKRPGWENELEDAKIVTGHYFGLEPIVKKDLSAVEMVEVVSEFGKLSAHGVITCLVVMAHGDMYGNIKDKDEIPCAVQDLVNALNCPELSVVYKIVLLSFCRGALGIDKFNRTGKSWESAELPTLVQSSAYQPVTRVLTEKEIAKEWDLHPFPSLYIPEDLFISYSTLPDSISVRGLMLQVLNNHLSDLYKYSTTKELVGNFVQPSGSGNGKVDVTEAITGSDVELGNINCEKVSKVTTGDAINLFDQEQTVFKRTLADSEGNDGVANSNKRKKTNYVELVELMTDVAGRVREKSRYTIYLNHCYRPGRRVVFSL